jgi:outer membrane protein assembly factor BamE (lipoprotein component of BamABCDE complex)
MRYFCIIICCFCIFTCKPEKEPEKEDHSLSNFSKVKIGMKYDEIVELVGKPTAEASYLTWDLYKIAEGWYIGLFIDFENTLVNMHIINYSDVFELQQKKSSIKAEEPEMEMKPCSLFSFLKVKIGMKYDEVVELVGKPTDLSRDLYKISEGWYIDLFFGSNNTLVSMYIVDYSNEREFKLRQKESYIKAEESEMEMKPGSLSSFSKVKLWMKYDEVVELMGDPTDTFGSGVTWYRYIIDDWNIMLLFWGYENVLVSMYIEGYSWEFKLQRKEASIKSEEPEMEMKPCSLSNFSKVKIGMKYDEIIELLGKPTATEGSGITWYLYKIAEGWYIRLFFSNDDTLISMYIVDYPCKREFKLEQKE